MNIALMGATSHIAKGLIHRFLHRGIDHLYLFARSSDSIHRFLEAIETAENGSYSVCTDYQTFASFPYDVVINCVGVETRNKHDCDFTRYFALTEHFDNLAIAYLKDRNPEALYVSFSSGAVYGRGFSIPANEDSINSVRVNQLDDEDYYGIVRINAEAKHRAHKLLNIVDLRVFSYFSRFINLTDGYFITDLMQSIINDKVLITDDSNMVRDYLSPDDLFSMIQCCINVRSLNCAFDVNSSRPVSKQDILDYFAAEYELRYAIRQVLKTSSTTGTKTNYYSTNNDSSRIGYRPRFSSMDTLRYEARHILRRIS